LAPLVVALVGPSGAGKTTLGEALALRDGVAFLSEPSVGLVDPSIPYMGLDQSRLQLRYHSCRKADFMACSAGIVVVDRWIREDLEVFLELHRRLGGLTSDQVRGIRRRAVADAPAQVLSPHAFIIVTAEQEVLRSRVASRGGPSWLVDSLDIQFDLYTDFLPRVGKPAVWIDTSGLSLPDLHAIAEWIVQTMGGAIRGTAPAPAPRATAVWKLQPPR